MPFEKCTLLNILLNNESWVDFEVKAWGILSLLYEILLIQELPHCLVNQQNILKKEVHHYLEVALPHCLVNQ